ncbi:hypothetical protein GW932_00085 [archaeon]|nr:hypothetical protein [archaeon]
MVVKKIANHEGYIFAGILMVIGTSLKLLFNVKIDSDWFWFIAGVALVIEGIMNSSKQKQFNNKFKVVSKEEYEKLWGSIENQEKKK